MDWIKEKMYQARLQRIGTQQRNAADAGDAPQENLQTIAARQFRLHHRTGTLTWLIAGGVMGVMLVFMAWRVELPHGGGKPEFDHDASASSGQHPMPAGYPAQDPASEEMREAIARLTLQVHTLTASVSELKEKLTGIQAMTGSITAPEKRHEATSSPQQNETSGAMSSFERLPPPAAGLMSAGSKGDKNSGDTHATSRSALMPAAAENNDVNDTQSRETIREGGPWVINLASLQHKADADRFVSEAKSRGVTAQVHKVTVKGQDYWRVHVPGFSTAAEARASAGQIKEKLELKNVWIVMR